MSSPLPPARLLSWSFPVIVSLLAVPITLPIPVTPRVKGGKPVIPVLITTDWVTKLALMVAVPVNKEASNVPVFVIILCCFVKFGRYL